jgi:hypothetical protein
MPSIKSLATVLLVFVVAALAVAPVLGAGFHHEDFTWLALARHLESPWTFFYKNVGFTYFYRPFGLLLWYVSAQAAAANPWLHNLFDLLLQAFNAVLVAILATRLCGNRGTGAVAGLLFACLPATSARPCGCPIASIRSRFASDSSLCSRSVASCKTRAQEPGLPSACCFA